MKPKSRPESSQLQLLDHDHPLHPTSLTKWRQRVGADKLAVLLGETIALELRENQVTEQELSQVNVDTTVQEKNITYLTESKLLKLLRAIAYALIFDSQVDC